MTALELAALARDGDRRALARLLSWVEAGVDGIDEALASLPVRREHGPGAPVVVGLTGPPGSGKSTLVDALVALARRRGERVAVIAVDPSSPRTGGALLGDRVRMAAVAGDDGVFVRSLGSRGHLGGLALAVADAIDVFDGTGWDRILIETVGVGQSEVAVAELADVTVAVLTPESGDAVQAQKAGLLEIADVVVVHKADRPGADALVRALQAAEPARAVVPASALNGTGLDEVETAIHQAIAHARGAGRAAWNERRGDGRERRVLDRVAERARGAVVAGWTVAERAAVRAGRRRVLPP